MEMKYDSLIYEINFSRIFEVDMIIYISIPIEFERRSANTIENMDKF